MFQTKVVQKIKTHLCPVIPPPPPENRAVYEMMWKNIVERGRTQATVWRMRIACWIPKATGTHTEYVILIAFPLQQWLHERASMLRGMFTACLVLRIAKYGLIAGPSPDCDRSSCSGFHCACVSVQNFIYMKVKQSH
jgi:hypothetical protein